MRGLIAEAAELAVPLLIAVVPGSDRLGIVQRENRVDTAEEGLRGLLGRSVLEVATGGRLLGRSHPPASARPLSDLAGKVWSTTNPERGQQSMSMYDELLEAAAVSVDRALIRISATYEPAGGPEGRLFPPTYPPAGSPPSPYVIEPHLRNSEKSTAVLLDSVPSQANRAEEAVLRVYRSGRVRLPLIQITHEDLTLTSLDLPHRYADAYLRDSQIAGIPFDKSEIGKAMLGSSLTDASALYLHDPGSLIYGAWNSHRKGFAAKFPRIYSSEILGWEPLIGARRAGRMDPLNLQGAVSGTGEDWEFQPTQEKASARKDGKSVRLSEIGHGNIAPGEAHGGVTVSAVSRTATVSMSALDRIGFGAASRSAQVAARAALAAYALMADRLAFARGALWLRSGCELLMKQETLSWVGRGDVRSPFELDVDEAVGLFETARDGAAAAGLKMALDPIQATPNKALADAINFTLTRATSTG